MRRRLEFALCSVDSGTLAELLIAADVKLMYWINIGLHSHLLNMVLPWFDEGDRWRAPLVIIWLAVMLFGGARGRWIGVGAVVVVILTDALSSHLLKPLIGRIRPCNILGGIYLFKHGGWIITPEPVIEIYKSSYAFPSGHATNAAGQAVWWGLWYRRQGWWLGALAFLIGLSRIYDGVHWPLDVIAGWGFGIAVGITVWSAALQWGPKSIRIKTNSKTTR